MNGIMTTGSLPAQRLTRLAAVGGVLFLGGLLIDAQRAWTGFLMAFSYVVELSLAGLVMLALLVLCNARWADTLLAVPSAMSAALSGAAVLGLVLLGGLGSLYEWSHEALVQADVVLARKAAWLNVPAFALRLIACFAVWLWLGRRLVAGVDGWRQGDPASVRRQLVRSAVFMAVFAVTYSVASVDWIMSLEARWFSTIFALRAASGLALAGLAAAIVLVILLERRGALQATTDQLHDLGKLLFSFSVLWVYLWYCQYMLIWYSNLPEETSYFTARSSPEWRALSWATLALEWGAPFAILLLRRAKRSRDVLLRVAIVVLIGHAFDLYMMIGPALSGDHPRFGVWEAGCLVGGVALFFGLALRTFDRGLRSPVAGRSA